MMIAHYVKRKIFNEYNLKHIFYTLESSLSSNLMKLVANFLTHNWTGQGFSWHILLWVQEITISFFDLHYLLSNLLLNFGYRSL